MIYIILAIVWAVTWGCITKKVNENKGYYGGFWLGFWLGFIGLIIVSCKEDNRPAYNSTSDYIAPLEKSEEKVKSDKEVENLQKLKAYKDLLDSGVISQEEFDKKNKMYPIDWTD